MRELIQILRCDNCRTEITSNTDRWMHVNHLVFYDMTANKAEMMERAIPGIDFCIACIKAMGLQEFFAKNW